MSDPRRPLVVWGAAATTLLAVSLLSATALTGAGNSDGIRITGVVLAALCILLGGVCMAKVAQALSRNLLGAVSTRLEKHRKAMDVSTSLQAIEQDLRALATEQEKEANALGSIARSLRLQTDAVGVVRKQTRAVMEGLQRQSLQGQQTLDVATAGRDVSRKVLNVLRGQARDNQAQLSTVSDALGEFAARADGLEVGQRRAMNFMRREGSIQTVLDRLQAAERRLLASFESGALTTASEVSEATARSVDGVSENIGKAHRELDDLTSRVSALQSAIGDLAPQAGRTAVGIDGIDQQLADMRGQISRAEESISGTFRTAEHSAEGIAELRGGLDALLSCSTRVEGAVEVAVAPLGMKLDNLVELSGTSKEDRGSIEVDHAIADDNMPVQLAKDVAAINANLKTVLRLSDTVKNDVKALHRHVDRAGIETVRQTESLLQLLPRVDTSEKRYPASGGFAMNPDSLLLLADLISRERPTKILELGSGTSTVWLGTFAASVGGSVISIDHLEQYRVLTEQSLAEFDLGSTVELRLADLSPVVIGGEERQWYNPESIEDLYDIDMVIVDGPPESTGPEPRYPAFPTLREKLADRALIVVDDLHREQEIQMVEKWMAQDADLRRTLWGAGRTGVLEYVRAGA